MDELKYNSEGYYDPTTYEALVKIEQSRRNAPQGRRRIIVLSYISAPLTPGTWRRTPIGRGTTAALPW